MPCPQVLTYNWCLKKTFHQSTISWKVWQVILNDATHKLMNTEVKGWYRKNYVVSSKGKEEQSWNQQTNTILCEGKLFQEQYYTVRISLLDTGCLVHHQLHHGMYFWSFRICNRKETVCPIQNHLCAVSVQVLPSFPNMLLLFPSFYQEPWQRFPLERTTFLPAMW